MLTPSHDAVPEPDDAPAPTGDICIRVAESIDVAATAALHQRYLPHGLFPSLGDSFMRRWHRSHVDSPVGLLLIAEVVDVGGVAEPVGFLLGSYDQGAHVNWTLSNRRVAFVRAGLAALLVRPRILTSFVHSRFRPYLRRVLSVRSTSAAAIHPGSRPADEDRLPVAVLEAIAVRPEVRSRGVGARLVECYVDLLAGHDVRRVELVTKTGSKGATSFYERLGWSAVEEHRDRDGDEVRTFRLDPVSSREDEPPAGESL